MDEEIDILKYIKKLMSFCPVREMEEAEKRVEELKQEME